MKNGKFGLLGAKGFTMVELLMVVLLVSILAVIGITQYKDFSKETRNAALKANLQILRNGISQQYGQSKLRCGQTGNLWPKKSSLNANDVTSPNIAGGGMCDPAMVPNVSDRPYVGGTGIPANPWGPAQSNMVYDCVADGGGTGADPGPAVAPCVADGTKNCASGAALANTADGWCYDPTVGKIWANSARNDGANLATGNEYTY